MVIFGASGDLTARLDAGPVIWAEGFRFELERRGYLSAGEFVPEVALEYPDALRTLHVDFQRVDENRSIQVNAPLHFVNGARGDANLLVCPGIDSANISYNLLKTIAGHNIAVGPILLGAARPVHILTPTATVRRIVNMTALAVVDANSQR
jgi:hypothetical protein